jgi:NAD-dependent SIR2 family protein deacetylase
MSSLLEELKEGRKSLTPPETKLSSTASKTKPQPLNTSHEEMHGTYLAKQYSLLDPPMRIMKCNMTARPGYATVDSSEYLDTPDVLRTKVRAVVELFRRSKRPCLYTGAGISTASGIGDYASEAAGELSMIHSKKRVLPYNARPTLAHRVFTQLGTTELTHMEWINQNHDGLPQKAGFPQNRLNDIHGAWYDVSNPVVAMSGSLRGDLYARFEASEESSDLVLALGTSLSGMNVDRMVTTPWSRGADTVIVSLQRTQLDNQCSVRIFAKIDDFAAMLCEEMGQVIPTEQVPEKYAFDGENEEECYVVPYNGTNGMRDDQKNDGMNKGKITKLKLFDGAKVKLTIGPHEGDVGEVVGRDRQGHYIIIFQHRLKKKSKLTRPFERRLGAWWVKHALDGESESPFFFLHLGCSIVLIFIL